MRASDLFDNYIDGTMSATERSRFEAQLAADEVLAAALEEHLQLLGALEKHSGRAALKKELKAIHDSEFGINSRVIALQKEENFASRHGKTIAVAASTAFIAVFATVAVLSTGGYLLKKQSNQITDLNRVVMELKASSDAIVEGITRGSQKKAVYAPANYEGSAFALNNKGYILTSYHMVHRADSIFIQNERTDRTLTRLVYADPAIDLAVLKLTDESLHKGWEVPFGLRTKSADLGERVFTLGYPRKEVVYGEGSLSSLSGYSNDTSMYQISIPVNPGNSGGPLLDDQGNVIGVIRGKISTAEATGFAIKSEQIRRALERASADTTLADLQFDAPKKSTLKSLKRSEQIKRINPYVYNVLVYKGDN